MSTMIVYSVYIVPDRELEKKHIMTGPFYGDYVEKSQAEKLVSVFHELGTPAWIEPQSVMA